jgi:hypothetical protein
LYLELRTTIYTGQRNWHMDAQQPDDEPDQWRPL